LKLLDEPADDGVLDKFLPLTDFFLLVGNVGITPVATLYLILVFTFASCSNSSCSLVDLAVSLWWADPPPVMERPWRPEPPLTDTAGHAGPPRCAGVWSESVDKLNVFPELAVEGAANWSTWLAIAQATVYVMLSGVINTRNTADITCESTY